MPKRSFKLTDDVYLSGRWELGHPLDEDGMPEKVGTYSSVSGMRINPAKVEGSKVFRTSGWTVALIVSEEIKEALGRAGITGTKFTEVTGPSSVNGS